jgi:phosphatidylglycerophosphate synthase
MTTVARISSPSGVERPDGDRLSPWLSRHAVVMLVAVAMAVVLRSGLWVALAALASFAELGYRERAQLTLLEPYGGYANQLTALRLGLLLTAAVLMNQLPDAWLWLLLAANVVVDVADGHVARRTKQVSSFGAVFDREVDAVFVLVAYLYFFVVEGLPAWVLIPGLLPYVYRLSTLTGRSKPAPQHRERFAPVLAGTNFVVLLIAVGAPPAFQLRVVILSAALVGVSFLVSFVNLYRNGHSAS